MNVCMYVQLLYETFLSFTMSLSSFRPSGTPKMPLHLVPPTPLRFVHPWSLLIVSLVQNLILL